MSITVKLFLLIKRFSANSLAVKVFPTPVGPAKSMEQIGLFAFLKPALALIKHL